MELLTSLYYIDSPSKKEEPMINFITNHINTMENVVFDVKDNNIYITKGKAEKYPCIIAHTDQVSATMGGNKSIYILEDNGTEVFVGYDNNTYKSCGLGADDKNGIWIALKMLEKYDNIKIAFFSGEEIGCYGSNKADMTFFENCKFVLQCDRKGNSDLITTISSIKLCSKEFIDALPTKKYNYKETTGLMTDVMTLKKKGLKVSCCNISCGYYNPHSSYEVTNINDLKNCLNFVDEIIETLTDVYPHKNEYVEDFLNLEAYENYFGELFPLTYKRNNLNIHKEINEYIKKNPKANSLDFWNENPQLQHIGYENLSKIFIHLKFNIY